MCLRGRFAYTCGYVEPRSRISVCVWHLSHPDKCSGVPYDVPKIPMKFLCGQNHCDFCSKKPSMFSETYIPANLQGVLGQR